MSRSTRYRRGSTPSKAGGRRDENRRLVNRPTPSVEPDPSPTPSSRAPGASRAVSNVSASLLYIIHTRKIALPLLVRLLPRRRERVSLVLSSHLPSAGREMASAAFAASARALSTANLARTSSTADASFSLVFCATSAPRAPRPPRTAVAKSRASLGGVGVFKRRCARLAACRAPATSCAAAHSLGARPDLVDAAGHGADSARARSMSHWTNERVEGAVAGNEGGLGTPSAGGWALDRCASQHRPLVSHVVFLRGRTVFIRALRASRAVSAAVTADSARRLVRGTRRTRRPPPRRGGRVGRRETGEMASERGRVGRGGEAIRSVD